MNDHLFNLGDTIEIDGIKMRIDEVMLRFDGFHYHFWWLANGGMHGTSFSEPELIAITTKQETQP